MAEITKLSDYQQRGADHAARGLKSSDGGDTFDPMEPRVAALESAFQKMDSKLDTILADVSYMKGRLEGMPTAISLGELKGRVDSLPTTAKIGSLLAIAVAILTLVAKWGEIISYVKH